MKAAAYFQKVMQATRDGQVFDAAAVREEGLVCRAWLEQQLRGALPDQDQGPADRTVVITHFAPSARSADPRYGLQPTTASFCNADDDLIGLADLWIHGHVHWRPEYTVPRPAAPGRVVCQARGLLSKGEVAGFDPLRLFAV